MIEAAQLSAVTVAFIALVIALFDMGMNGARYASGAPFIYMGVAGLVWLFAESVR